MPGAEPAYHPKRPKPRTRPAGSGRPPKSKDKTEYVHDNAEERHLLLEQEAQSYLIAARTLTTPETEAAAMVSIRQNRPLDYDFHAVRFDEISVSHLSPKAQNQWHVLARRVSAAIDFGDKGLDLDQNGMHRRQLRELIVDIRGFQREGHADPEFVLALTKLVESARQMHDLYDVMWAAYASGRNLRGEMGRLNSGRL
jgi:hypothetical protein